MGEREGREVEEQETPGHEWGESSSGRGCGGEGSEARGRAPGCGEVSWRGPKEAAGRAGFRGPEDRVGCVGQKVKESWCEMKGGGEQAWWERGGHGQQHFLQELGAPLPSSVLASSGPSAGKREKVPSERGMSPEH